MLNIIKDHYKTIYTVVLSLIVISLPLSRFGLSVAQFGLLGIWLLEADFKEKYFRLKYNIPALVLVSLFLLHVIGLIYTSDVQYAFKDIRIKLPLLLFPVVLATIKPLGKRNTDLILLLFVFASLAATFISFGIYLTKDFSDIREISPFISHIRLSLNICIAIFFAAYFVFKKYKKIIWKQIVFSVLILWMILFLFIIESVTGIFVLVLTTMLLLLHNVFRGKTYLSKSVSLIAVIIIPVVSILHIQNISRDYLIPHKNDLKNLMEKTILGHNYEHDTLIQPIENGSYIGLYVCEKELRHAWNSRSTLDYDGKDLKNQNLKYTLIRYLNSKDLRKDQEGVMELSDEDIGNIEQGIANVYYAKKFSINSRLYKILWEYEIYRSGYNPGGHSLIQRLEFWKTSIEIIRSNFWIGVGTGDIVNAYKNQYEISNSKLDSKYRHRAHNQFLAIFVTFGVIGFLWFIFTLLYPAIKMKKVYNYHYFSFLLIIVLSMLVEDTLETQMGVTLFAFFNSFLLFTRKSDN